MRNLIKLKPIATKELKEFGLLMTWAFPLFIGIIAPWIFGKGFQWWTLWVSLFFVTISYASPKLIYIPYRVWMLIGGIMGFINTRIILGFTFYCLIFPIGIILKTFNKLQFKKQNNSKSNYITKTEKLTKEQLENPF